MEEVVHSWLTKAQESSKAFKAAALRVIHEQHITQEDIAGPLGVNHSTIARWLDSTGDLNMPGCYIPLLNTEKVKPLAHELIRFIADPLKLSVVYKIPIVGALDGSLKDETLDIVGHVGRLADLAKEEVVRRGSCRESKLRLLKIIEVAHRGLDEVNAMEKS